MSHDTVTSEGTLFNLPYYQRLNRESRVWHPLRHENILEFLGIYQDPKKRISAMVSPLCSNGNLVDYLKGRTENDVVRPFLVS